MGDPAAEPASLQELWASQLTPDDRNPYAAVVPGRGWYGKQAAYWKDIEASVDGVLGGDGFLDEPDIVASRAFLTSLQTPTPDSVACDCGAGIGRVCKGLLKPLYRTVDLVEPDAHFLAVARSELSPHRGTFFLSTLQHWAPPANYYDCIWVQWVLNYLHDEHLEAFLRRCSTALKPHGFIVLKENVSGTDSFILDTDDTSVTRSLAQFHASFEAAGLAVVREEQQTTFPDSILPVWFFALQPR
eukprot:gnl/Spiro4/6273_TR3233_c0_g2_i1.p1 gnl/Spiro4/6273_TR3233_c0_g2~~gnl/Spiro4/6273_TR3233_c0_g2_i1.p1  ORF type:complete len:254 (-),score=77.27 gnl/Spiro4/6273_TR3233_c0_g2_i1:57-788(-)